MNNSNLFRILIEDKTLKAVKEVEFSEFNFKGRCDIQEWVESNPNVLGENLLIIGKDITETRERPELIAIDTKGNIVIIELKRDDSWYQLEWHAIRQATYLSMFSTSDIVNLFEEHLNGNNTNEGEVDQLTVKQKILEFIDEDSFDNLNKKQRLILVSHRFAKEVTSVVNWLIEKYQMDIKCIQMIPYYDKDKNTFYMLSNIILPVPGIKDIIIKADDRKFAGLGTGRAIKKDDEVTRFCNEIYDSMKNDLGELLPSKRSRWAGMCTDFRYFHLWYDGNKLWDSWGMSYRIWLYPESAQENDAVRVIFEINKRHLLNNGIDESNLNELEGYLKDYSQKHDFKFYSKDVARGIETTVGYDAEMIRKSLTNLIAGTYVKVKEAIER